MKKILIISFTFPPAKGIGGRRWAKFAKYLNRAGYEVEVIAAKKGPHSHSWADDLEEYKQAVNYLPTGYPEIFQRPTRSTFEKILYRFLLLWLKLRVKGNFYDHSSFWFKQIEPTVRRLLEENERTIVIASGGPFTYLSRLVSLKKEYPEVGFYVDFRDPWTSNRTAFGYLQLSAKRLRIEKQRELFVVRNADGVLSVAEEMTSYFKSLLYPGQRSKFLTLPNGYDLEDYPVHEDPSNPNGLIKVVFAGTYYNKAEHLLLPFIEALKLLNHKDPELSERIAFEFYGEMSVAAMKLLTSAERVTHFGLVGRERLFKRMQEASFGLLFLTEDLNYSFSTKFCDFIALKKPLMVISNPGVTGRFVEDQGLGVAAGDQSSSILSGLREMIKRKDDLQARAEEFDSKRFNISELTEELVEFIDA